MPNHLPRPPIDTLYPESPVGDAFETAPKPLSSELERRLKEIGTQDKHPNPHTEDAGAAGDGNGQSG